MSVPWVQSSVPRKRKGKGEGERGKQKREERRGGEGRTGVDNSEVPINSAVLVS